MMSDNGETQKKFNSYSLENSFRNRSSKEIGLQQSQNNMFMGADEEFIHVIDNTSALDFSEAVKGRSKLS